MPAYFDLRLTPNRSLDRRHARWLMIAVAGVFMLGGVRLLVLGAWPVIPFMVADVALLGWALRASYRSGRAYEMLRLDDEALTVRKVTQAGTERRFRFEPFGTRVELERVSDLENHLWLASRDLRVAIGGCLSPGEREEIHAVIASGLARCRAGGNGYSSTSRIA